MKQDFKYRHFTAREIKPTGWLRDQLLIQAKGLSGHLDKMWPDIMNSAWIGGDKEGWERVPYWLDGFIPMAYLLDDDDLKERAQKYVEAILAGQNEDGWICPCAPEERERYDTWAVFLICKVLVVYAECTGDPRIQDVVEKTLYNLKDHVRRNTLFKWGQSRWFESLVSIYWLYDRTGAYWLIDLAVTLATQGLDYKRLFTNWRDQTAAKAWKQQTHIVNLAMALKGEALFSRISGEKAGEFAEKMYSQLYEHHGTIIGHINGDECLCGRSPVHGSELCAIVEYMYSGEWLFEITGETRWADLTEQLAFNSLPATNSEDMWTHQYLQQVNQIACCEQEDPKIYYTNSADANIFGLEPNYGCCTANFSQGWPKFALSTFYRSENGIVSGMLAPAKLACKIGKTNVKVTLETAYPFRGSLKYIVETEVPVTFDLGIRIPAFAASATVDGEKADTGSVHTLKRCWEGRTEVAVELGMAPVLQEFDGLYGLRYGALFFAVPIEARKEIREYVADGVERKFPYCDNYLYPVSPWNYAFHGDRFAVKENPLTEIPFSRKNPPVTIAAQLDEIRWSTYEGQPNVCAEKPESTVPLGTREVELKPYGCTDLRMTVIPYNP